MAYQTLLNSLLILNSHQTWSTAREAKADASWMPGASSCAFRASMATPPSAHSASAHFLAVASDVAA